MFYGILSAPTVGPHLAWLVSPLVLLTLFLLPPGAGQAADLFTPVTEPRSSLPADDLTLRRRVVTMDLEQVRRVRAVAAVSAQAAAASPGGAASVSTPGAPLTLNLFEDVVVTARVNRTAPTFSGGYAVSGHLVEEPPGSLTLVVNGETVAGTVRRLGKTYHIRSVGAGVYAISEVAPLPFSCGVEGAHSEADHQH